MLHHANECMGIEYCVQHEGEKRWLRMDVYMISKEDGMVRDGVLTFRNVTEERTKELEIRAEEERAKKALIEAYEAAQQGSLAKTDFLSKMSHDIRTPMNAIIGMTVIALTRLDDRSRMEDCLTKIALSSRHLLGLINDVLDMSKIEGGKLTIAHEPFNFKISLQACRPLSNSQLPFCRSFKFIEIPASAYASSTPAIRCPAGAD